MAFVYHRFKNGEEVRADARIKITRDCTRLETYNLTLNLVKCEDAGDYEVKATNSLGTASTLSHVKILSKLERSRVHNSWFVDFNVVRDTCEYYECRTPVENGTSNDVPTLRTNTRSVDVFSNLYYSLINVVTPIISLRPSYTIILHPPNVYPRPHRKRCSFEHVERSGRD